MQRGVAKPLISEADLQCIPENSFPTRNEHPAPRIQSVPEHISDNPSPHPDTETNDDNEQNRDQESCSPDDDISEITPTESSILFEAGNPDTGATTSGILKVGNITGNVATVLVESVPGLMTSPDFCMFVRPFSDAIVHFRPLRLKTERNRYIVIMKFKEASDASNFAQVYQGKHFLQGLVQETCHVRQVQFIAFHKADEHEATGFPSFAMFPSEGEDALPAACAVCLERLDAKNGALITTFCNHTMHAACLSKWDLNRCPVCRHTHELRPEASVCMTCDRRGDIWMCAVCGFVGCGIYTNKHAHAHFDETQHPFAISLEDRTFWGGEKLRAGAVWDYSSERFVNRLLTSEDGKVVEVAQDPARSTGGASRPAPDAACCSSENVGIVEDEEHDRALQAAVYASRMDAIVDDYRARLERMEAKHTGEKYQLQGEITGLKEALSRSAKEKKGLQKRISDTEKESKNLVDRNGFLKNLSDTLLRDNREWNEQVEKLKRQLAEAENAKKGLEDEIRDLMMHLKLQDEIAGAPGPCRSGRSELQGGDLRIGPSPRQRLATKIHRR